MAQSPQYKIYYDGTYHGALKFAEDAAALVAVLGDGAQIRFGHKLIVWREGDEQISAHESYDIVADTVRDRVHEHNKRAYQKIYGHPVS